MALVSRLIQSGFSRRQASAIGFASEELTVTGTSQSDAVQIVESFSILNGGDLVKGAILPTFDKSKTGTHYIFNPAPDTIPATGDIKIYPAVGERINLMAANTPFLIEESVMTIFIFCDLPVSGRSWFTLTGTN